MQASPSTGNGVHSPSRQANRLGQVPGVQASKGPESRPSIPGSQRPSALHPIPVGQSAALPHALPSTVGVQLPASQAKPAAQ